MEERNPEREEAKVEEPKREEIKVKKLSKEEQMEQIKKIKELYKDLPKEKEQLFAYELDWPTLAAKNVVEIVCRPWISKKMVEYMGVEEQMMINIVVKLLHQKCTHAQLFSKIHGILDDTAEEFVEKLWKVVVFEDMKIKA